MNAADATQTPTNAAARADVSHGVRRTLLTTLAIMVFMGGLSFAAVPIYDYICRVTGFAGTTQRAEAAPDVISAQTIQVRFDANKEADLPWTFTPVERAMEVQIGENAIAFYRAHNPTDAPVSGRAVFNVAPFEAGAYFSKIECFCFTEQTLQPGQSVDMPVSFFVDPSILDDVDNNDLKSITLSYTFYRYDPEAEI